MSNYLVDAHQDVTICLNSNSVAGSYTNVKSECTIPMEQLLELPRGAWDAAMECISFSSAIVNYDEATPPKVPTPPIPFDLDYADFYLKCAFLTKAQDGKCYKERGGDKGEYILVQITEDTPTRESIAQDFRTAFKRRTEIEHFPGLPNPDTLNTTKLILYEKTTQGVTSNKYALPLEPILNRAGDVDTFFYFVSKLLQVAPMTYRIEGGHVIWTPSSLPSEKVGFRLSGTNIPNLHRMIKVFGGDVNEDVDTMGESEWTSPYQINLEKPESNTHYDPYNLCASYFWWDEQEQWEDRGLEFCDRTFGNSMERIKYEDLTRSCKTLSEALDIVIPSHLDPSVNADGKVTITIN
ncbi:hypothetical protein CAPTEDRAFT_192730 [Capitella teleta]|uniref:Uncharacterized protein n=1 Tax=Capitella teleta TaxID=283909 RepID=R7U987_CAPTE|nr:hypothetical protein CAPTEDRAFT_192730 [Capitella teleta]|eukprot:ELU02529.1 hypothetical protein CAPTEDRAFT_192730 [Capitella teleta]